MIASLVARAATAREQYPLLHGLRLQVTYAVQPSRILVEISAENSVGARTPAFRGEAGPDLLTRAVCLPPHRLETSTKHSILIHTSTMSSKSTPKRGASQQARKQSAKEEFQGTRESTEVQADEEDEDARVETAQEEQEVDEEGEEGEEEAGQEQEEDGEEGEAGEVHEREPAAEQAAGDGNDGEDTEAAYSAESPDERQEQSTNATSQDLEGPTANGGMESDTASQRSSSRRSRRRRRRRQRKPAMASVEEDRTQERRDDRVQQMLGRGGEGTGKQLGRPLASAGEMTGGVAGSATGQTVGVANKAANEADGGEKNNKKVRGDKKGKPGGRDLKLRLDLHLDVEVELKASIRGDLTLSLMQAFLHLHSRVWQVLRLVSHKTDRCLSSPGSDLSGGGGGGGGGGRDMHLHIGNRFRFSVACYGCSPDGLSAAFLSLSTARNVRDTQYHDGDDWCRPSTLLYGLRRRRRLLSCFLAVDACHVCDARTYRT